MTLQYGEHDRDPNQIPTYIRWIGLVAILLATTLAVLTGEGKGQTIGVGDTLTFNDREVTEQVDCYDGDTCTYPGINRDFRLAGIDAPEIDGPCRKLARSAQAHLQQMVRLPPQEVAVVDIGEHGRWIVDINVGNLNVNSWMLARGFATRWPIREPSTLCDNEAHILSRLPRHPATSILRDSTVRMWTGQRALSARWLQRSHQRASDSVRLPELVIRRGARESPR